MRAVGPGHPLAPLKEAAPLPADGAWPAACVHLAEARALLRGGAEPAWIGHADTGWARHPGLPWRTLDHAHALDAFTGTRGAEDPLERVDLFDGHGTGTLAVALGVSPGSRATPVRCANSVVLFSDVALVRALDHLSALGAWVITISLGGLPSAPLRDALHRAVFERQAIVVAAGGQRFPLVPYPAAYGACIAAAACGPGDVPWRWTTGGRAIDVTAPGHQVAVPDFGPDRAPLVRAGSGTSYATPHVAGAAALWLSHHGRERLLERYAGAQPLQEAFRVAVTGSARTPQGWRTGEHGAGILDVAALLGAPLPPRAAPARARAMSPAEHDHEAAFLAAVASRAG